MGPGVPAIVTVPPTVAFACNNVAIDAAASSRDAPELVLLAISVGNPEASVACGGGVTAVAPVKDAGTAAAAQKATIAVGIFVRPAPGADIPTNAADIAVFPRVTPAPEIGTPLPTAAPAYTPYAFVNAVIAAGSVAFGTKFSNCVANVLSLIAMISRPGS